MTNTAGVTFGNEVGDALTFTGGLDTTAGTCGRHDGHDDLRCVASDGTQIDLGPVTLAGTSTIDTAGGVLNVLDADGTGVDGIATAGNALTLNGGATGVITVSTLSGGGALTLTDSGSTTFNGAVTAGATTLTDTTGTVSFEGDTTLLASLVTTTAGYGLSFTGASNTVGGATTLQNTGALVLGNEIDGLDRVHGWPRCARNSRGRQPVTTSLAGTVATQGGTGISLNAATLATTTTLDTTNAGADAAGAAISTGTLTAAGNDLTLDAGTGGVVTVNAFTGANAFTLLNGASATFAAASDAGSVDLNLTTGGAIAFDGLLTATMLTTDAADAVAGDDAFSLALNAGATITNDANFDNTGALTLGSAGTTSSFAGGLDTTAVGGLVTLNGLVSTTATNLDVAAATLGSDVTLSTGTAAGDITAGAITAASNALTLAAGAGSTTIASVGNAVPATDAASTLTVTSSTDTIFTGVVSAADITLTSTTGTVTFQGDTTVSNGLTTAAGVNNLVFEEDLDVLGALARFTNVGNLRLGLGADGDVFTFNAGLDATGVGGQVFLNGEIITNGRDLELADVTLEQATTLDSQGGDVTVGAVTGATFDLTLDAGDGAAAFGRIAVDSVSDVGTLSLVDAINAVDAVTFAGAAQTNTAIDLNGTQGGTYTFDGLVTTPTLTTNVANDGNGVFALTLNGGTSITNAVAFDNTGALTLVGTPVDQVYVGGVDTTGVGGTVTVSGDVRTNGTGLVTGPMTLGGTTLLDTTNAGATAAGSTLTTGAITGGSNALTLDAGTGGVVTVASLANGGDLTLVNSGGAIFSSGVTAANVDLRETAGTVEFADGSTNTFTGALTTSGALALSLLGDTTVTVDSTLANTGGVTFGNEVGDALTFTGGLDTTAAVDAGDTTGTTIFGVLTSGGTQVDLGPVTLAGTSTIDTAGGVLNVLDADGTGVDGIATAGSALTLNGGATGVITISTLSGGGALTLTDSGSTTFNGAVTAGATTLTDTTGTVSFEGDTTLASLVTTTAGYGLSFTGASNTVGGATVLQNTGALELGDATTDSIEFTGGLDARGVAGTDSPVTTAIAGTVQTAGGVLDLNAVSFTAPSTLATTAGGVTAGAAITTGALTANANELLTVDAGTAGNVTVASYAGAGDLTLTNGDTVRFLGAVDARNVLLTAASTAISFEGNTTVGGDLTTTADGYDLSLTGTSNSVTNVTDFLNTGTLTLGDAATDSITFVGGLDTTAGPGALNLAGTIATTDTAMMLRGATITANTALRSGAGQIDVASLTDGLGSLTLDLQSADATGLVRFAGDLSVNRLVTATGAYNVELLGGATIDQDTNFLNTGDVTLGNDTGDLTTFSGGLSTVAVGTTNTAGTVATAGTRLDIGTMSIDDSTTITTAGGDLFLAAVDSNGRALALDALTGTLTVSSFSEFGSVEVVNSGGAIFTGTVDAGTVMLTNTSGTIEFAGNTTISTDLVTMANGYNVAFSGATNSIDATLGAGLNAPTTEFLNTGTVTLGDDATDVTTFVQGVDTTTGPSATNLAGAVVTGLLAGQDIRLNATALDADGILVSGAGLIEVASIGNGPLTNFGLTVQSATATGAVSIGGFEIGSLTTLAGAYDVSLLDNGTVTGDTDFLNTGVVTLGDQGDAIDELNFNGGLDTTQNSETRIAANVRTVDTQMDLSSVVLTGNSTIRSGAGAVNVASIFGPAQTLTLQSVGATGAVTVAGDLTVDTLTTTAAPYAISLLGGASVTTDTTFTNTGAVRFGDDAGDLSTFASGLDTTATAGTFAAGTLATTSAAMDLNALTITDGAGAPTTLTLLTDTAAINVASVVGAGSTLNLQQAGSTGAVTVAGDLTVDTLGTFAGNYAVSLLGGGTVSTATSFANTGVLTLGDDTGDALRFVGGLDTTAVTAGTSTAGEIATTNTAMTLGALTLTANTDLDSGSATLDVASVAGAAQRLAIQSSTSTGTATIAGDISVLALDTFSGAYDVALNGGGTVTSDTTFLNTGVITLGNDAGDLTTFAGGLDTLSASTTNLFGTIRTTDTAMDLGTTILTGSAATIAGAGTIDFASVTDADAGLTLSIQDAASTGAVTFGGNVNLGTFETFGGAYNVALLGGGTVDTDTTFLNTTRVTIGDAAADATTFIGGLDTTAATTTSLAGTVATTDTAIDLGATMLTDTTTLVGGAGSVNVLSLAGTGQALTFQDATASGAVTVTGGFALGSLDAAAGPFGLSLLSSGTVTGATMLANSGTNTIGDAAGDVFTFNDGLTATAGSTVLFGDFSTVAAPITLSDTSLAGTTSIATAGGNVTATDVDGGAAALTLDLSEGNLALTSFTNGGDVVLTEAGVTAVTSGFAAANLDLNAGTSFSVGGDLAIAGDLVNNGVDALTVNGATSATNLTSNAQNGVLVFNGATSVGNALTITNGAPVGIGAMAATFNGALTVGAGGITVPAQPIAIVFNNDVMVAGLTSLRNTGGATLGSDDGTGTGDTLVFTGGLDVAGATSMFADLSTAGVAGVILDEALTLTGPTTMTTAGGDFTATSGIDATAANIAISTDGGDLTIGNVTSGIGLTSAIGTVTLASGGGALLAGSIISDAGDLTLTSAGGATTLGTVTYAGAGDTLSISTANGALTTAAIIAGSSDLAIAMGTGSANLASVDGAAAFTLNGTRGSSAVTIGQIGAGSFTLNGAATYASTAGVAVSGQTTLNDIDTIALQGNTTAGALALTNVGSFTAGSRRRRWSCESPICSTSMPRHR